MANFKKILLIYEGESDQKFLSELIVKKQPKRFIKGGYKLGGKSNKEKRKNITKIVKNKRFLPLLLFDSDLKDKDLIENYDFTKVRKCAIERFITNLGLQDISEEIFKFAHVVVLQLETWYLAGCTKNVLRNFTVTSKHKFECKYTKHNIMEDFTKKPNNKQLALSNLQEEILNGNFSVEEAFKHNISFKAFVVKIQNEFNLKV